MKQLRWSFLLSYLLLAVLVISFIPTSLPFTPQATRSHTSHTKSSFSGFLPEYKNVAPVTPSIELLPVLPETPHNIQTIINQITPSSYLSQVSYLSGVIGSRSYHSAGNDRAVEYIARQFEEFGLNVSYHYFGPGQPNVIGTLPGSSLLNNECIIVGAHLDTYPDSSPGADDNGSGIGAVLEMARAMSQFKYNYTILFVAFNQEEQGLIGSSALATDLVDANVTIACMYNFDMIMWDSPLAPPTTKMNIVHNGGDSAWFAQHAANIGQNWVGAPIQAYLEPYWVMSDHKAFWDYGIPAVWFFEYDGLSNPFIHSVQDSLSQPDYSEELGAQTTQTATGAVTDIATIVSTQPGFPEISFLSPISGTFVHPSNTVPVILSIEDEFDDVNYLELSVNNGPWINATTGLNETHCTYYLDASSMYGLTNIEARAYDADSWIARSTTAFTIDQGIYCNIHTPQDDEMIPEGLSYRIWINVTDPDGRYVPSVLLRINQSEWNSAIEYIRNKEYYYDWQTSGAGETLIETRVIDGNGNSNSSQITCLVINFPPIITDVQMTPLQPLDTDNVRITATITQDSRGSGIAQVLVYFSVDYSLWSTRRMSRISGETFMATLDPFPAGSQVRFYIHARDNFDNVAINNNNGAYYAYIISANPTLTILLGSVVAIIVIVGLLYYFLRYRRRSVPTPT